MPYSLHDNSISPLVTIKMSPNIRSLFENHCIYLPVYALAFCRVSLKILSGLHCAKVKEPFFWICENQAIKGGASRPGSYWGCWWQQEPQQENPKGKGTQGLPSWRFEDSNLREFDALRRDGGFVYAALPMNFCIFPHYEAGAYLRRSE